jgi:hypothetical protein
MMILSAGFSCVDSSFRPAEHELQEMLPNSQIEIWPLVTDQGIGDLATFCQDFDGVPLVGAHEAAALVDDPLPGAPALANDDDC